MSLNSPLKSERVGKSSNVDQPFAHPKKKKKVKEREKKRKKIMQKTPSNFQNLIYKLKPHFSIVNCCFRLFEKCISINFCFAFQFTNVLPWPRWIWFINININSLTSLSHYNYLSLECKRISFLNASSERDVFDERLIESNWNRVMVWGWNTNNDQMHTRFVI